MGAISREFPAAAASMSAVRRFVGDALRGHPRAFDATLVADELATNAFQHTEAATIAVTVTVEVDSIGIAVCAAPAVTTASPRAYLDGVRGRAGGTRGRGLLMVDQLSSAWGTVSFGACQVVAATLDATPPPLVNAAK